VIGDGYADTAEAVWVTGDARFVARNMPPASVDLIITSPPFLELRSYLPDDDPAKAQEIGHEETPGAYLDALLDLVVEWRRILTPHGSLCVELGDTYSGSGGAGGDYNKGGLRDGQERFNGTAAKARAHAVKERTRSPGAGWPLDKCLAMIPQSFAWALAYGRNPWTGREIERWRVRNVVRWCRPNPPVGRLADKFRPATSEMTVACTSRTRWFDLDAVRIPNERSDETQANGGHRQAPERGGDRETNPTIVQNPNGAPPRDYWEIPTFPYEGSHYATFPPALVERPIEAMCPRRVCTTCGVPSTRIVDAQRTLDGEPCDELGQMATEGRQGADADGVGHWRKGTERTTLGWTDCGHDTWRPGRVLDPFGGSGTTLQVALGKGRDSIGIDLDRRNADLARERVGPMFLQHLEVDQLLAWLDRTPESSTLRAG
jgi:DNA modification methylase